jgi:hypothetical protein
MKLQASNKQPNCFLIGAMKAGTTALAGALSRHSQVFMPSLKEPQFFTDRAFFNASKISQASYRSLYASATHMAIDASTWYLYDPDSARLIYEYNPNAKIIAILRNPADRAFSHWQYLMRDRRCPHMTFFVGINDELKLLANGVNIHAYPYLGMGRYGKLLERYYRYFPCDQIRVFFYEDLIQSPNLILSELQAFLGLSTEMLRIESGVNAGGIPANTYIHSLFNSPNPIRKTAKAFLPSHNFRRRLISLVNRKNLRKQCLSSTERKSLVSIFSEDILEAEVLLGTSLAHWRVS